MRYKITLSYDGAQFNGWQVQPDAPSVQGSLEKALSTLLRSDITVTGAGRTDTGVNALAYVAHFDSEAPAGDDFCAQLSYKLNAILPRSIAVLSVEPADDDFHARFGATRREYTYFLHRVKDPFVDRYSYFFTFPLDFDAMNEAASLLVGTHDFSCFEKLGADNRTSVCTVFGARWEKYTPTLCATKSPEGEYWVFRISANRFLRNMVRAVVGTLLDVGRGRRTVAQFAELIDPGEVSGTGKVPRNLAGESVPGNALFLSGITY